jgi:hypothetical protein
MHKHSFAVEQRGEYKQHYLKGNKENKAEHDFKPGKKGH